MFIQFFQFTHDYSNLFFFFLFTFKDLVVQRCSRDSYSDKNLKNHRKKHLQQGPILGKLQAQGCNLTKNKTLLKFLSRNFKKVF